DERIARADRLVQRVFTETAQCQKLARGEGIGPVIATALVAAVGNAREFANGRHLAAWLGLVPRQCSSGGKERLLGISKRGRPLPPDLIDSWGTGDGPPRPAQDRCPES